MDLPRDGWKHFAGIAPRRTLISGIVVLSWSPVVSGLVILRNGVAKSSNFVISVWLWRVLPTEMRSAWTKVRRHEISIYIVTVAFCPHLSMLMMPLAPTLQDRRWIDTGSRRLCDFMSVFLLISGFSQISDVHKEHTPSIEMIRGTTRRSTGRELSCTAGILEEAVTLHK